MSKRRGIVVPRQAVSVGDGHDRLLTPHGHPLDLAPGAGPASPHSAHRARPAGPARHPGLLPLPLLAGRLPSQPPLVLRALGRYPVLQAVPARLIGLGVLPEHVRSPTARGVQPSRSARITRPTQPGGTLPPPGPA